MANKHNQFQRGASVYSCRCCKRATRGSGGDSAGVHLCDQCYELAGYENMLSDGDELTVSEGSLVLGLLASLDAKNGAQTACWTDLKIAAAFAVENKL